MAATQEREIALFWDYENAPLPVSVSPADAAKALQVAVSRFGQRIEMRRVYFDPYKSGRPADPSGLDSSGFDLVHTPARNMSSTLDKKLIVDVLSFAWDSSSKGREPCVVLITSDGDYAYTLSKLRDRGVMNVVMYGPNCVTTDVLVSNANAALTSRGKQLYREDVDPEDKDRALAAAPPSTALVVSTAARAATYAPPPPVSTTSQYGRVIAQTTQLPNASPLPDREQVLHSGHVLSRISFRTILMKKWKQSFWIQYGPSSVLFFRNATDYEDWVNNPYLNNSQRDFLVKLQIDFVGDLTKVNVRGYQVTHVRMKAYKGKML